MSKKALASNESFRAEVLELRDTMSPMQIALRLGVDVKKVYDALRYATVTGKRDAINYERTPYDSVIIRKLRNKYREGFHSNGNRLKIGDISANIEAMAVQVGHITQFPDYR